MGNSACRYASVHTKRACGQCRRVRFESDLICQRCRAARFATFRFSRRLAGVIGLVPQPLFIRYSVVGKRITEFWQFGNTENAGCEKIVDIGGKGVCFFLNKWGEAAALENRKPMHSKGFKTASGGRGKRRRSKIKALIRGTVPELSGIDGNTAVFIPKNPCPPEDETGFITQLIGGMLPAAVSNKKTRPPEGETGFIMQLIGGMLAAAVSIKNPTAGGRNRVYHAVDRRGCFLPLCPSKTPSAGGRNRIYHAVDRRGCILPLRQTKNPIAGGRNRVYHAVGRRGSSCRCVKQKTRPPEGESGFAARFSSGNSSFRSSHGNTPDGLHAVRREPAYGGRNRSKPRRTSGGCRRMRHGCCCHRGYRRCGAQRGRKGNGKAHC